MTEGKGKKQIELLAPAGSFETFKAVIRAGADAVYLGGGQFGARAYADNFGEAELMSAIDYAHLNGRQVYLTVNTLLKEDELEQNLYSFLLPYYKQGLDAVIVQDMGAFSLIRREFPGMDIHASTQMNITGRYGAEYMKKLGASRIVTAREMSLAEIREIHDNVNIEIESFVHGALCYCYSGQCLLSSMIGGRSGNRGRCAQPCRLPYEVYDSNYRKTAEHGAFVLSPKDLCTISFIPELAEHGVYSFKIEGRMKKAEYAAGVVSVYRHYLDRFLNTLQHHLANGMEQTAAYQAAKNAYQVSEQDMQKLLDFGNRSGFTDGYYHRRNGKEMITFGKPNHAKANETLQNEIRENYVREGAAGERKEKINGILKLKKDFPATIEVNYGKLNLKFTGQEVQAAQKQPLSFEKVEENVKKTGNTPFIFEELQIEMDEHIFLPVQALKQLRREALDGLSEALAAGYRRKLPEHGELPVPGHGEQFEKMAFAVEQGAVSVKASVEPGTDGTLPERENDGKECMEARKRPENLAVSIENRKMAAEILECAFVQDIYFDSSCYTREHLIEALAEDIRAAHAAGKKAYYALPSVFRSASADFYKAHSKAFLAMGLDGILIKSIDEAAFAQKHFGGELSFLLDHSLYSWNCKAIEMFAKLKPLRDTVPLELNRRELFARDNHNSELVIYGNLPLMVSAQCIHANTGSCDRRPSLHYLKDRYGNYFPVKNNCMECYNTIYNTTPLMLFGFHEEFRKMNMAGYRISFTTEDTEKIREVLALYQKCFLWDCKNPKELFGQGTYTNGHYKRGVE